MNKFLVLSLLVCQAMNEIVGDKMENAYDSPIPSLALSTVDNSSDKTPESVSIHINGTNQIFYINSPPVWKWPKNLSNIDSKIRPDYTVRNGIDAHKVHHRKVSWNMARQICIGEGGHLAAIRTTEELEAVKILMGKAAVESVWLGFHDLFQEGEWATVLDEPLAEMEWDPWTKQIPINPDNANGNEHCAVFLIPADGINDMPCAHECSFVCKINMSCR